MSEQATWSLGAIPVRPLPAWETAGPAEISDYYLVVERLTDQLRYAAWEAVNGLGCQASRAMLREGGPWRVRVVVELDE